MTYEHMVNSVIYIYIYNQSFNNHLTYLKNLQSKWISPSQAHGSMHLQWFCPFEDVGKLSPKSGHRNLGENMRFYTRPWNDSYSSPQLDQKFNRVPFVSLKSLNGEFNHSNVSLVNPLEMLWSGAWMFDQTIHHILQEVMAFLSDSVRRWPQH